jgi:hypothetical protein
MTNDPSAQRNLADVFGIPSPTAIRKDLTAVRRAPFVIGPSADRQKAPQRTHLLAGDFILDIVETSGAERPFTYMVHRRSSGEVLTLGVAPDFEQAERIAVWTVKQLTGTDPGFNFKSDAASVA